MIALRTTIAFVSGAMFAIGLGISGALHPRVVQGFLDVTGRWDPTLLVMFASALVTFALLQHVARRMTRPVLEAAFDWPPRGRIDRALVAGSATFGVGWGLGGVCPGPALVAALWNGSVAAFTIALLATIAIVDRARPRRGAAESCG